MILLENSNERVEIMKKVPKCEDGAKTTKSEKNGTKKN